MCFTYKKFPTKNSQNPKMIYNHKYETKRNKRLAKAHISS